jgi:type I restriction enzyme S subunit
MGKEWTLAENDAQGEWTLPDGWVKAPVSEIYDIIGGGTPSTKVEEYWQGDIPWISSADIHGPRDIRPRRGITKSAIENSATNLVPAGSLIVVTRVGLGKVALAYTSICFSQDSQALVGSSDFVLPDYAIYYLSQAVQVFKHRSRGTTIAGVTKKQLADLPFALPPLPEQRRIVAEIETQFTRLDAAVAALERAQANIRRYRAAVLKAACEGRLVPTEAELARVGAHRDAPLPYEPADQQLARILAEHRAKWEADYLERQRAKGKEPKDDQWKQKYKEPASPDTESLPELPEGWAWATVEQISEMTQYGTSEKANLDPSGIPVLRMGNIQDGELDFSNLKYFPLDWPKLDDFILQDGDVLFNRTNSAELVGKTAVYKRFHPKAVFASYLIRVRTYNDYFPDLLSFYINSFYGRRYIASVVSQQVGQANVSGTKLSRMPVVVPPLAEQRRIVAEVERRLSLVAALEASVEAALARAGRLRQAVLKQAFEGRLVPQDPDDEPASVLLERIKAERAQQGRRSDRKAQPKQMELF